MKPACMLLVGAAVLAANVGKAQGANLTLRELLAQGFEIKATEALPAELARSMSGSQEWHDDLLIVLQKGPEVALCHSLLWATIADEKFLDFQCFVPK